MHASGKGLRVPLDMALADWVAETFDKLRVLSASAGLNAGDALVQRGFVYEGANPKVGHTYVTAFIINGKQTLKVSAIFTPRNEWQVDMRIFYKD